MILGNMEQLMEEMGDHSGKGCTGKRAGFSSLGSVELHAAHVVRLLGKALLLVNPHSRVVSSLSSAF